MAVLRSLLELYGGLDHALIRLNDPDIDAHVDNLLPRASANTGWYDELHRFFFGAHPGPRSDVLDPRPALTKIIDAQKQSKKPLTAPQKSRLFFGIAAHARLDQLAQDGLPPRPDLRELLAEALAVAAPKATMPQRREHIDYVAQEFTDRGKYASMLTDVNGNNLFDGDVAEVKLCQTATVTVNGMESVVIDTDFESSRISLQALKAIVDPRNWHKDYPEFFLAMAPFGPRRRDDWGRVRETVGLSGEPYVRQIVTALKYFKSANSTTEARVDYDLDNPTPSRGDGQVLVDRGFINMECINLDQNPSKPGVHVRTRKVVHIKGLRPYTQQRLVCLTGYGTAAKDFLFGGVENAEKPLVPWDEPVTTLRTKPPSGTSQSDSNLTEPTSHVAQAVANVWTDYVEDLTNQNLELCEKWTTGTLDFTDLANYSKDVGGRLMSSPWEFLQALNEPSYRASAPQ
ncbi:MAG: hypothetical protein JOZ49_03925, partial [Mycolicibacterium sp.]|nr:hypothetical protein [Mycolicibacterium sp.]